jgi:hypothetical protein
MKKIYLLTLALIGIINVNFAQQNESFFKDVNSFLSTNNGINFLN